MIVLLVREIERARGDGEVYPEVDAFYSATFFLLGTYGVLTTTNKPDTRDTMLSKLVALPYAVWKSDDSIAPVQPINEVWKWNVSGRSFDMSRLGVVPA